MNLMTDKCEIQETLAIQQESPVTRLKVGLESYKYKSTEFRAGLLAAPIILKSAYEIAVRSKDNSTQLGSILLNKNGIVIGTGVNNFPLFVKSEQSRYERPQKYYYTEHAERDCIYQAVASKQEVPGSTLFCPWFACADCARAIIKSKVKCVIGHLPMFEFSELTTHTGWSESIIAAFNMFDEVGIEYGVYTDPIPNTPKILVNGKYFDPSKPISEQEIT